MNPAPPPPSSKRRLLACCGFAACWLGAAVTGFQATAGDRPGEVHQAGRAAVRAAAAEDRPQEAAPETPGAEPIDGTRTAIREYWR